MLRRLLLAALLATPAVAELPPLLDLAGGATTVRYTPGALDRAAHVQARFELLAAAFADWSGEAVPLTLAVLPRDAWESAHLPWPYGVPAGLGPGEVALPARGDAGTVALWRRLLGGGLPTVAGRPLGGTPGELASLVVADVLAQVEAARALVAASGLRGDAPWVEELAVHAVALSAFARHEEPRLVELGAIFAALAEHPAPAGVPATGYPPGLGVEGWLASQGRFFAAADRLLAADGARAAKRLLRPMRRGRGLESAEILRRHPELERWLAAWAPASGE